MSEDEAALAKRRYAIIVWVRALGVLAMVLGIVIWKSDLLASGGLPAIGFPLFVLGFIGSMGVPQWLVRRWRTPRDR